jgi:hypothetical protein
LERSLPTGTANDNLDLLKRQRPFPKCCRQETNPDGSTSSVWEIRPVAGETEELIRSMCAGMPMDQPPTLIFGDAEITLT